VRAADRELGVPAITGPDASAVGQPADAA
jgi:hypothetical protein